MSSNAALPITADVRDQLAELAVQLPVPVLLTDPRSSDAYRDDRACLVTGGRPLAVVRARTIEHLVITLRWATKYRIPVVPRGAGTGLSGGAAAVDGCVVLSTAAMTKIRELNPRDRLAVVEAGVITADLDQAAAEHGLLYAPDPASHRISTIGGNLATNAGGLRCLKYGVTRDAVLGLEAVLADGRVIRTGGRTVKGVAGYDLTRLLVGSEGTLAVIATATLRLRPRPMHRLATFTAAFPTVAAAGNAALDIINAGLQPNLLELMDRDSCRAVANFRNQELDVDAAAWLIGQSDSSDAAESARSMVALCKREKAYLAWATTDENEAEAFLSMRRMAYPAVEQLGLTLVEDVVVPLSRLADLLVGVQDIARRHDIQIPTVAHAGDGNAHPVVVVPRDRLDAPTVMQQAAKDIYRLTLEFGGTVTGEHGVGLLKREWLSEELDDTSLSIQRAIKAVLDPSLILNPGKGI